MSVRRAAWRYSIPVLTLIAGTLFAASASTARGTDLRASDRTKLTDLITEDQRRYQSSAKKYRKLREETETLSRQAGERDARVRAARSQAEASAATAGFTPVTGPAVEVTLDDAPRAFSGQEGTRPDDLVVHQQDVQGVVNALWSGGATGMQIMDQRLIATSAVRCVGNTLILQGVVYSPPFRITATGEPERLRGALDGSPAVRTFKQYVSEFGLGYAVRTLSKKTIPAYNANVRMKHATVP